MGIATQATRFMSEWLELVQTGKYAEAEAEMLAETDRGEGFFPLNEVRASFYEKWGDALSGVADASAKYQAAELNWRQWASCSTSGGEGTARMVDVQRVVKKLEALNADR